MKYLKTYESSNIYYQEISYDQYSSSRYFQSVDLSEKDKRWILNNLKLTPYLKTTISETWSVKSKKSVDYLVLDYYYTPNKYLKKDWDDLTISDWKEENMILQDFTAVSNFKRFFEILNIYRIDDDYYLVCTRFKDYDDFNQSRLDPKKWSHPNRYFKCDQIEGLQKLLKDKGWV